jgi:hypothetical protein
VNDKGEPALVTYKIVGEDGGAFWVEVANESYYGKTVTKILLFPGDRMNPNTMEIRAVKMKDKKGQVTEIEGPMLQLMKSMWQSSINMLAVSWQGLPQESMPVIAGTFTDCFKARTDASWGAWHAVSTTWMHPAFPSAVWSRAQVSTIPRPWIWSASAKPVRRARSPREEDTEDTEEHREGRKRDGFWIR